MGKKVVLVSGSGETASAVSSSLALQGFDLILVTPDREFASKLCGNRSVRVEVVAVDPLEPGLLKQAIDRAVLSIGNGLHSLVNMIENVDFQLCEKTSPRAFQNTMERGFLANINVTQACISHLKHTGCGAVIFLSSLINHFMVSIPGLSSFESINGGIEFYAKVLFEEIRSKGIRVSTIIAGLVNSEIGRRIYEFLNSAAVPGQLIGRYSMIQPEQMLQPTDISNAVNYVLQSAGTSSACPARIVLQPQTQMNLELRRYIDSRPLPAPSVPISHPHREVALITGASKGIGRDIAINLAKQGYHLALLARTAEALNETEALCLQANASISTTTFVVDVQNIEELENAVHQTVKRLGNLTVLISNAGVNRRRSALASSRDVWDQVMETNLRSSMHVTRVALLYLCHNQRGSVVFVGSSVVAHTGMAGSATYFASKHGLKGFAACIFEDVRMHGVKVSCLYPGLVNTEMGTKQGPLGSVFDPQDLIQSADISEATLFVLNSPPTACPVEILIHPQKGTSPNVDALTRCLEARL